MQGREARGTLPGDDRPLEDICDAAMNDVAPSRLGRVTGRGATDACQIRWLVGDLTGVILSIN